MFKKSRVKIILAVMVSIIILLFGTLAVILGTSYAQMNTDNSRMLEQYVREYRIEENEKDDAPNGRTNIKPGEEKPSEPNAQPPEELHKFDVSTFYSVADPACLADITADLTSQEKINRRKRKCENGLKA